MAHRLLRATLPFLLAAASFPQSPPQASPARPSWKKQWIVSVIALAAANFLDAHSSLGRPETNPWMRTHRGNFSAAKGAALKTASAGSVILLQGLLARKKPEIYKPSAIVNYGCAGVLVGVAARNSSL